MKTRYLALLLVLVMLLTACGEESKKPTDKNDDEDTETTTTVAADENEMTTTTDNTIEGAMIVNGQMIDRAVFSALLYDATMYTYYETGLYQYEVYYGVDVWKETFPYKPTGEKLLLADYIKQSAKDTAIRQVAVQQLIAEYGVEIPAEELKLLREEVEKIDAEKLQTYGFDADSYVKATASSLEESTFFYEVYGIGGKNGVTEEQVKAYYTDNFVSYYIAKTAASSITTTQRGELQAMADAYNTTNTLTGSLAQSSVQSANSVEDDKKLVEAVKSVAVGSAAVVEYTDSNDEAYVAAIVRVEENSYHDSIEKCVYGIQYEEYDKTVQTLINTYEVKTNDAWIDKLDPTVFIEKEEEEENPALDSVGTVTSVTATHYAEIVIKDYGTIKVALDAKTAPLTVANFKALADEGFYNGLTFHRIIEGFMMQGGDPKGNGTGGATNPDGSEKNLVGEFAENKIENPLSHVRGAISMARANDFNSASSQFFIVHKDSKYLDGQYAVFGYVVEGIEVVDAVCEAVKPIDNSGTIPADKQPVITSITVTEA